MKKYTGKIIVFIVFIFYIVWSGQYEKKQGRNNYTLFMSHNIIGVIQRIRIVQHSDAITIKGSNQEFVFSPITDKKLNGGNIFTDFAEKGDSVIKKANSDTLILIKSGKRYYYMFQKY
ncbi:MAG: hypothetical protein IPN94_23485 [Sphingobacteriales bacterium]|jgi:hypothetical protein|nr:hypothetical protein [Sphingobacteriales bacterium]